MVAFHFPLIVVVKIAYIAFVTIFQSHKYSICLQSWDSVSTTGAQNPNWRVNMPSKSTVSGPPRLTGQTLIRRPFFLPPSWQAFLHMSAHTHKMIHISHRRIRWKMGDVCFATCVIWRNALWSADVGTKPLLCSCKSAIPLLDSSCGE